MTRGGERFVKALLFSPRDGLFCFDGGRVGRISGMSVNIGVMLLRRGMLMRISIRHRNVVILHTGRGSMTVWRYMGETIGLHRRNRLSVRRSTGRLRARRATRTHCFWRDSHTGHRVRKRLHTLNIALIGTVRGGRGRGWTGRISVFRLYRSQAKSGCSQACGLPLAFVGCAGLGSR